jgi:hypothetical protein
VRLPGGVDTSLSRRVLLLPRDDEAAVRAQQSSIDASTQHSAIVGVYPLIFLKKMIQAVNA